MSLSLSFCLCRCNDLFRTSSSQKVSAFCFPDSYNIDQHDYSVRLKAARKFLQDGDKVVPIYFFLCVLLPEHIWASYALSDYILLLRDL